MKVEIEITPELLKAAERRQFLIRNASDIENLPSDVWNRDYDKCQLTLAMALEKAILEEVKKS